MKNIYKIIVLALILNVILPTEILAQYASAMQPDNYTGATCTSVANTGNDSKFSSNQNNTMRVWVADGTFGSLAWDDGTNIGSVLLNNGNGDIVDPDVALVEDNIHLWWAIVVYYNQSASEYDCEMFKWSTNQFITSSQYPLETGVSYANSINVDASAQGKYIIVWDDSHNGIFESHGATSTIPSVPTTLALIYPNGGSGNYTMPDVSIYNSICYITYIWDDGTDVDIMVDSWDNAVSSLIANFPVTSGPIHLSDGFYHEPRIACPNLTNCPYQDFALVYRWDSAIYSHIMNATYDNNTSNIYIMQDFTALVCMPDSIYNGSNYKPVVTYSSDFNGETGILLTGGFIAAWTSFEPNSSGEYGYEPYAIKCDESGNILTCTYMIAPEGLDVNLYSTDVQQFISVAGRDNMTNDDIFYVWSDEVLSDILYKDVPFSSNTLRKENIVVNKQFISGIYPNPASGNFQIKLGTISGVSVTIEIYNSLGERIYSSIDISQTTNFVKEISLTNLENGIYFVRETNGINNNNWKLVVTK